MKKKLIATAGVAAFALAAAPMGVFAATSSSFTDEITVNVPDSCTIETSDTAGDGEYADREFEVEIAAGSFLVFGNSDASGAADASMTVKCNVDTSSQDSWTVTAVADNSGALVDGNESIESGEEAESGDTSTWSMLINVSSGIADTDFDTYQPVPTAAAGETVLEANAVENNAANNVTFRPQYKVYVQPNQAPGNYEGSVTYTVAVD